MLRRSTLVVVCLAALMSAYPVGLLAQQPPPAEVGTISGTVVNKSTGDPIIEAGVEVVDQGKTSKTDLDGRFTIKIAPGTYQIRIFAPLFQPVRLQGVVVKANQVAKQNVSLAVAQANVEVVEVVAQANRAAEATQLVERKKSAVVSETVSAETIKKTPDKDVAAVVKRVPAVTIKDDRFVYVRGLGERYSSALLNGSRLPSTDPDKRVVPLDLFPAEFVQSLSIFKSYTPDLPGDFSGGLVDIRLADFPDRPSFTFGQSLSGNTQTTLQKFRTYRGSSGDYLGFGAQSRDLPGQIPDTRTFKSLGQSERDMLAQNFRNVWSQRFSDAAPNLGLNFSTGNTIGPFGFSLGGLYRTDYQTVNNRTENLYVNGGAADPLKLDSPFIRNDGLFTTRLGGVLTSAYQLLDRHKLFFRALVDRNSYDDTQFATGVTTQGIPQQQTILRYTAEELDFGQLGGEHRWNRLWIDWRTAFSRSTQDEPDTRYTTYQNRPPQFTTDSLGGTRLFNNLNETLTDSVVDFTIPFTTGLPYTDIWSGLPAKFKFGPAYAYRQRTFDQRRFEYQPNFNPLGVNLFAPPEDILSPSNLIPGVIDVQETTQGGDSYKVSQEIIGGYGMFDVPIVRDRLRFVGGARVEYSYIRLLTQSVEGVLTCPGSGTCAVNKNNLDPLPAANLIFSPRDDMNFRLGYSQSVSRPEFRELSPTQFPSPRGLRPVNGNPALVEANIDNYDARWEWFFSPLELVSVSFFRKSIEKPIEQALVQQSSNFVISFQNADNATLTGFEFEGRKNFGFIRPWLQGLSLSANVAYINSTVQVPAATGVQVQTAQSRALQGQAPYVANATLEYTHPQWGTYRVLYQTAGATLVTAPQVNPALPGIDLQSRNQLDAVAILPVHPFGVPLTLKLGAENLLNDAYEQTQGGQVQRLYTRGIKVSLGVSYTY